MIGLLIGLTTAQAGALPVAWNAGQHIYTHPRDWRPAGVSDSQLASLEATAQSMHTPVYVVLIDGEKLPGSGDGQRRLQIATDALMTDWGSQGLDLSRYSVFSVAWGTDCNQPPSNRAPGTVCEYFLNTGSDFIHGPAHFLPSRDHKPITDEFRSRVSTTPQDPVGGIREVIQATDQRIWPHVDPVQVRKRAERELDAAMASARETLDHLSKAERDALLQVLDDAAEVRERDIADELHQMARTLQEAHQQARTHAEQHKRSKQDAKAALDRLGSLMESETELPADLKKEALNAHRTAVERIDKATTTEQYNAVTSDLGIILTKVSTTADRLRAERDRQSRQAALRSAAGTAFIALCLAMLFLRRRKRNRTREAFDAAIAKRGEELANAMARYTELELSDRHQLDALGDTNGLTADECHLVRTELDAIYAGIRALEAVRQRARSFADQAGALNVAALEQAIAAIDAPFDYNTGELVNDQLFTGGTRIIHIEPPAFMVELQERFAAAVARRDRLRQAAAIRFQSGVDLLPHSGFDELEAAAVAAGLPISWLSDHPLYGDDESDQGVWAELDRDRVSDPLRTLNQLDHHRNIEAQCDNRLATLNEALQAVGRVQTSAPPEHLPTVMDRTDDPREDWNRARTLHRKADQLLQLGSGDADARQVVECLASATRTYIAAQEKAQALSHAVRTAASRVDDASDALDRIHSELTARSADIERAMAIHIDAVQALAWLEGGQREHVEARGRLAHAKSQLSDKRHLDSIRSADEAEDRCRHIGDDIRAIDGHLRTLENLRRRYEQAWASLNQKRRRSAAKIASYGETATLAPMPEDATRGGPTDFAAELARVQRTQEQWGRAVRKARAAYQRRIAEAQEAARRAERAARRSSYSSSRIVSSSSRSGSSFGSSRSSGGGSSFGGSRSSGGGGGW